MLSRAYLVHDVLQGIRAVDGEADEDEIRLGVGEWPQSVILFLTGSIPKGELDDLAAGRVDWVGDVVFEYRGNVFLEVAELVMVHLTPEAASGMLLHAYLWEVALAVADEEAGLAAAAIANNHDLLRIGRSLRHVRGGRLAAGGRAHCCADGAVAAPNALVAAASCGLSLIVTVVVVIVVRGVGVVGFAVVVRRRHDVAAFVRFGRRGGWRSTGRVALRKCESRLWGTPFSSQVAPRRWPGVANCRCKRPIETMMGFGVGMLDVSEEKDDQGVIVWRG